MQADGNRGGAFLGGAAEPARAHGTPEKSEIVTALDKAVLAALADAVTACFAGADCPPVLAHLAGGEDLLLSVPARDAWPVVRARLPAVRVPAPRPVPLAAGCPRGVPP